MFLCNGEPAITKAASAPMDVSIICVNWNSLEYLCECIKSIYEWTHDISFEVIVVDNASPKGDIDDLKRMFPAIVLVKSRTNLGFGGANNLGAAHASGETLLFLNPDTKVVSPAIKVMLEHLRLLPDAGIVGCKLLNSDLSVQTSSILKFPGLFDTLLQVESLRLRWPKLWGIGPLFAAGVEPVGVEAISGACMLIKREVFSAVGMFNTDYFMYSEDLDLCFRVARAGFRNYYVGEATIVHHGGKSSAPAWQTVMKTKAELQFCEQSYGRLYALMFRLGSALGACARLALIAGARFVNRGARGKQHHLETAAMRWNAILRTLLTDWSSARGASSSATGIAEAN